VGAGFPGLGPRGCDPGIRILKVSYGTIYHMAPNPDPAARVGIYARISDDRDGVQTATGRQVDDCRGFASRKGWEVAEVFEDVDISAFNPRAKRPEFERMLGALRDGTVDGIVVWKLDRLTRQQRDLSRVMEACESRRAFIASVMEPIDTRETYGQFVAELLVAQARMESANTSVRSRRKAQEERDQGLPPTHGRRCFGYEKGYRAVVPAEQALVHEAIERLFAGESMRGICVDWEARGVKTITGRAWRGHILQRFLATPTIAGLRQGEGELIGGTWPPLISPAESLRIRSFLAQRARSVKSAGPGRYLLTGVIRCGRCGDRMYSGVRSDESRRYVCIRRPGAIGCGKMSTLAEPVEEMVLEMILAAVDNSALREAMAARGGNRDDDAVELVQRDELALKTLADDFYVQGGIARDEFLSTRATLTRRLEANKVKLARRRGPGLVGNFAGAPNALREAWASASTDWRRAIVTGLLDRVVIMPATHKGRRPFDVDRVKPVWKY
jgi:site-specific DNA recombinase